MNNTYQIIGSIVLVLILLVGGGYFYYTQTTNSGLGSLTTDLTSSLQATSTPDADQNQTLQRLNELEDITIDASFLSSDVFRSFENFGIAIEPQPVGRSNPFEPTGVVAPADVSESGINIESSTSSEGDNTIDESQGATPRGTSSIDQLLQSDNQESETSTSSENVGG